MSAGGNGPSGSGTPGDARHNAPVPQQPPVDPPRAEDEGPRVDVEVRDLGDATDEDASQAPLVTKYDPSSDREKLRGIIAISAFALFSAVVLLAMYAVIFGDTPWSDLEGMMTAILPTVTSVVTGAVTFYFVTRDGAEK